ncbi:MAG: outer membrane protein assembly factor BamB [Neisseriales bacterium]|nr:MAG: outer membrane protein assembly factor BamB [Neisseriales bacterium]
MYDRIIAVVLSVCLVGCANLFPAKDIRQPVSLVPIKNTYPIITKWTVFSVKAVDRRLSSSFSPAYHDGFVYAAWPNGRIEAIDRLTGQIRQKWIVPKVRLTCTPAIFQRVLFLGTDKAELIAWHADNKQILWKNNLSSLLLEPPLIVDDTVITKTNDGHISGFDRKTGALKWRNQHAVPSFMIRSNQSLTAFDHSAFLLGMPVGYIYAIDPQTGYKLWQESITVPKGRTEFEGAVDVIYPPLLKGDLLYTTAYEASIVCFDLRTNKRQWSKNIATHQPIVILGSSIVMSTTHSEVVALDRYSGQELWRTKTLLHRAISGPVALGSMVMVMDRFGIAHVMDPDTGLLVGRKNIGIGALLSAPQSFDEGVLLQNRYGKLVYIVLGK